MEDIASSSLAPLIQLPNGNDYGNEASNDSNPYSSHLRLRQGIRLVTDSVLKPERITIDTLRRKDGRKQKTTRQRGGVVSGCQYLEHGAILMTLTRDN